MSAAGTVQPIEFQLPSRVLRKLLRGPWQRRARRVLIVANGCESAVGLLNRSGVQASGIDDAPSEGEPPGANVHAGSIAGRFPFAPHAFDLVLVGPCRAFEDGLNGPEPLIALANLLSSLKANRRLVWLKIDDARRPEGEDLTNRLFQVAGGAKLSDYHDGWERFLSLEWLIGRRRDVRLQLATVTTPSDPISRLNWHQLAREAALSGLQAARQDRAA